MCLRIALAAALLLAPAIAIAQPPPPAPITKPIDFPITIGFGRDLPSRILGGFRRINVHLPEHAADPGQHFPVLVLLDGGENEDFLHVVGLTQITAAYGEGQEMIVVGIAGVDRRHDLTSPSSVEADRKAAPTSGGAGPYRRFLVEELRPWIDVMFPGHGRVALMGESLAGLFTLETFLTRPDAFDDYISVSPSLWWNDGELVRSAPGLLRAGARPDARLWIGFDTPAPPRDAARRERGLQDRLVAALRSSAPRSLAWSAERLPEGHSTVYHPAALKALRALYGAKPASR